jgi:hypothetical protein
VRDFTLGIIGGCLTHQGGIAKSELYHRRLAKHLEESGRARLRVRIARGFDHIEHRARLDELAKEHTLDAVLVHVRNYYLGKSALIVKSLTDDEFRYHLHPFLFKPWKTGWAEIARSNFAGQSVLLRRRNTMRKKGAAAQTGQIVPTEEAPADDPGGRRVLGVSLRDLFYTGGILAGLDHWAVRDELRMLQNVLVRCGELGIPLFVLGPGRRPDDRWLDRMCRKLDRRLHQTLADSSAAYCDLPDMEDEHGEQVYLDDGWHLSPAGHAYVAKRLAPVMERWCGCRSIQEDPQLTARSYTDPYQKTATDAHGAGGSFQL